MQPKSKINKGFQALRFEMGRKHDHELPEADEKINTLGNVVMNAMRETAWLSRFRGGEMRKKSKKSWK